MEAEKQKEKGKQSTTTQSAEQSFGASKQKLRELRDERQRLELDLASAIKNANAELIIACRKGLKDLDDQTFPAEVASLQADLELCKVKIEVAAPQIAAAEKKLEIAVKVRREAEADERRLKGVAHEIWSERQNLERRAHDLEREISTRIWAGLQNNEKPAKRA